MEVVRREGDPYDSLPIRENLLRRMEEADISLSVVQPVVSRPETQTDVNRFAREIVRTNLISFGGLHPDCPHVLEAVSYTHLPSISPLGRSSPAIRWWSWRMPCRSFRPSLPGLTQ